MISGIESKYDYDASPEAWDEYKKIYILLKWDFWEKINFNDLKKQGIRLYAPVKINEKYTQFNQHSEFKMSGDTDFNFGKDKKGKGQKYEKFKELLKRDKLDMYLDKLDECYNTYHKVKNFSLMPMTGNLQSFKQSCKNDRLDAFVYELSKYLPLKNPEKTPDLFKYVQHNKKGEQPNKPALIAYLKLFDDIYDYCSKIYMIDSTEFINKIISQGEESIDSGACVVRYIKLAEEFWDYKRRNIKEG